ncbi:uncharacterized protein KZ484_003132 [Pholidichthys leucotaenia]
MTLLMFSFYFFSLFLETIAHTMTPEKSSQLHFKSIIVGQNLTLSCSMKQDDVSVMLFWYKQAPGQKPQLVSTFYKHEKTGAMSDTFNNSRFELETSSRKMNLKISNVQMSESGTYYCIHGFLHVFVFWEGTIVQVKGSGLDKQASVHQSLLVTVQPGGSVTLNCTAHIRSCDGEHTIYWFKNSKEPHAGLIYTNGGRNDQCEMTTKTQSCTCVYNLPMKSLNPSHAGTYYCAVASCGYILFGNGTKLDIEDEQGSFVLLYVLSGALGFNAILIFSMGRVAYSMYKTKSGKWPAAQDRTQSDSAVNEDDYQKAEHLHYAAVRANKLSGSRKLGDGGASECLYSGIKM